MPSPGKCPSRAFIGSRQRELPSASHRLTTLVHPRSPVVPFDTPGSARAEIPGHPRGPFRFREAPATASRDQTSPADFCNTTRPASTTSSCMTLARIGWRLFRSLRVCHVAATVPLSGQRTAGRPHDAPQSLATLRARRLAQQRATMATPVSHVSMGDRTTAGREASREGPVLRGLPSSKIHPEHPVRHRYTATGAWSASATLYRPRPPFRRRPAKGAAIPKT